MQHRQRSINEQVALVINSSASNVVGFRKRQQPLPLTSNDDATSYDELDDASRSPLAPRTQLRPLSELFSEGLERLRYLYYVRRCTLGVAVRSFDTCEEGIGRKHPLKTPHISDVGIGLDVGIGIDLI